MLRKRRLYVRTGKLEKFLDQLNPEEVKRNTEYWQSIEPSTDEDVFRRILFAILSVHTTWRVNVHSYNVLKDLSWTDNTKELTNKLEQTKVGLTQMRTKAITNAWSNFEENPDVFKFSKNDSKDWIEFRNDLVNNTFGLSYAKMSFGLSMIEPILSEVVCLDVHIIRMLGLSSNYLDVKTKDMYHKVEQKFVKLCKERGYPPAVVREMWWSNNLGFNDCRHWSTCLESN